MKMSTYPTATLREICDTVEYGYTASSSTECIGPRFLRITDIVPETLDWASVPYCEIDPKKLAKHRLRTGDIVIARTGATTGWAKYISNPPEAVFASYLVRIRPAATVNARFVGFVVESTVYKEYVQQHMGGVAQPNANAQVLTSYEIPLPPLPIQQCIAGILSAYDELIENSQRRIKILETRARVLYREWFVHFRFPGHEAVPRVPSSLGEIPQGWEVKTVKEILARRPAGTVYRDAHVKPDGDVPVIDQSTSELLGFHDFTPDHNASSELPMAIFGDHTCKMQLLIEPFSVGPNVVPFVASGKLPTSYAFYAVNSLVKTQEYKRHWSPLAAKEVIVADRATAERFSSLVQPMLVAQEAHRKKIRNLRRTRDLLLPHLLSGCLALNNSTEATL